MPFGYIYKIEFPNGKHYIGLTSRSLEQRQREHKRSAQNGDTKYLYNALRSHDMVDTFELIEIDTADTQEELDEKEIAYILEYNSYYMDGNGYNMTYGGEGFNGYVHTEEDKQQQSERQKKHYQDNPEARKKMKIISQIFWNNPESKEKMSELRLISHNTPQAKKNMSEGQKLRFEENPEERQQMSEQQKKRMENPEARQKISEGLKTYYVENPDAIQKNSEAQIKFNKDNPEAGKEHSEKMIQLYKDNPEKRQQMSEIKINFNKENPEAGREHSEKMIQFYKDNPEKRQQMSDIGKEVWKRPEHKKNILDGRGLNKPFDVLKDGTRVNTFNYQFEAREYLKKEYDITSDIKIGSVLNGDRKSSAGFVFKYK